MKTINRLKPLVWVVVSLLLAQACACAVLPRSYTLTALVDGITLALMGCIAFAFANNIPGSSGRTRIAWFLLAATYSLQGTAQLIWMYFEVILRQEVPNPFVADVVLFLCWIPALAALILRPHLEPSQQDQRLGGLDFAQLLLFWLYLYLFFVIPWQYVAPNEAAYGPAYNLLALIQAGVYACALGLSYWLSAGPWRRFFGLLFVAVVLNRGAAQVINVAIDRHAYFTGSWYDMPYSIAMATTVIVACSGFGLVATKVHRDAADERYWMWWSRLAGPVRLLLPVLAAWAFLNHRVPDSIRDYRILVTLGALMVLGTVAIFKQLRLDRELMLANHDLLEASLTDALTGARNRRFFTASIDADVQQTLRAYSTSGPDEKRNCDLVFYLIDADHFKEINDWYGHDVGDQLLTEMTRRISGAIRNSDVLIRWGGEEFLVVSRYTNRSEADTLAKRVLEAVGNRPFELGSCKDAIHRTCSVGWAVFPWFVAEPQAISYEEVLALADRALYKAKSSGRNQAIGKLPADRNSREDEATRAHASGVDPSEQAVRSISTAGPPDPGFVPLPGTQIEANARLQKKVSSAAE